jgi:hypothetical protein
MIGINRGAWWFVHSFGEWTSGIVAIILFIIVMGAALLIERRWPGIY